MNRIGGGFFILSENQPLGQNRSRTFSWPHLGHLQSSTPAAAVYNA